MNLGLEGTRVLVTAGASGIGLATARAFQARRRAGPCLRRRYGIARSAGQQQSRRRPLAVRRRRRRGCRSPVRNSSRESRRPRRAREQRGDRRADRALRGRCPGRLGTHAGRQSDWPVPVRAARHSPAARQPQREHRKSLVGGRSIRLSDALALCGVQVGASSDSRGRCRSNSAATAFASTRSARAPSPGRGSMPSLRHKAQARGVSAEKIRQEALAKTSLGQLIEPEDIGHAIVFLASRAGARISGQAIGVDADVQALV